MSIVIYSNILCGNKAKRGINAYKSCNSNLFGYIRCFLYIKRSHFSTCWCLRLCFAIHVLAAFCVSLTASRNESNDKNNSKWKMDILIETLNI